MTGPTGNARVHRVVLHDKIGPGEHGCVWCGVVVSWDLTYPEPGALVIDRVDGKKVNSDPTDLVPSCQHCNAMRQGRAA